MQRIAAMRIYQLMIRIIHYKTYSYLEYTNNEKRLALRQTLEATLFTVYGFDFEWIAIDRQGSTFLGG